MTNTYLSQDEYNRVIARKPISQSFTEWLAVVAVGLINPTLGVMYGFDMYVEDNILYNNIVDAGGAYCCVTEDATATAKIVLPWESHPFAQYYDGATVVFR